MATVGSDEKAEKAQKIGADEVILYKRDDFSKKVRKLTQAQGADVIFDHTGQENWEKNILALAKGGRLVTCGATSGAVVNLDLRFLFVRQLSVLGCYMGGFHELKKVLSLMEKGRLKPVVDKVFPLREADQALARMQSRGNFGKIVLTP